MKTIKILFFYLILIVGILLTFQSCQKEPVENLNSNNNKVSIDYAKQIALNFTKDDAFIRDSLKQILNVELRSNKQNKKVFPGFEEREIEDIITYKDDDGEVALYVFKFIPNGFVIVPSTTKETPILAFSNDGVFDESNIPTGILDWISLRTKVVDGLADDENYVVPSEINEQWFCLAPPIDDEEIISGGEVSEQVGPIISTRWGQGHGYNWLCPEMACAGNDGRALTGCVATAMAQIIRAWNYPNNYNYSIMPNQIGAFDPITSNTTEVARLMRDCGVAAEMSYGCNSSGTNATPMINALKNTFHFSSSMQYINFNLDKAIEQFEVFGWPIIMTGIDVNGQGGHAWVSDGYRRIRYVTIHNPGTYYEYETYTFSDHFLHMNWGWNGISNHWFFNGVPNVGWANFSNQQKMLIYIHPQN